ncbi:MAG: DUF1259 domain-containing protein [Proteobacteria bacterium]|nr:DUF1259 domain-containing protein [Pseudomonadota bacterium]
MISANSAHDLRRFGRRGTLRVGLAAMAAAAVAGQAHAQSTDKDADKDADNGGGSSAGSLPVAQMDKILQAHGKRDDEVVGYSFARTDLHGTLPGGIKLIPAAMLAGDVFFQSIGQNRAVMNADLCLTTEETNKFIDALIANGLVVQAFHQHLADISPMAWFIHFRGEDEPTKLASAIAAALKTTATPLPQPNGPPDDATPFDHKRLASIIGGEAEAHGHGVLEVDVDLGRSISLGGVTVSPDLNIATNIFFQPLDKHGKQALVVPDFGMVAKEINPVLQKMRAQGWRIGCLYNQETDENPQLYWSHMWKVGAPEQLAQEIRNGLDLCDMKYSKQS